MGWGRRADDDGWRETEGKRVNAVEVESSLSEKPEHQRPRRLADWLNLTGARKAHSLIDKVYKRKNLEIAWEKVKANQGAGGVDGESIEAFGERLEERLAQLHEELRADRYRAQPVRQCPIPKSGKPGEYRMLGIPTIFDRVCQQALLNRLESLFESVFDDASFGYRRGRSTKDALRKVWKEIEAGDEWIVDADLKDFFGSVSHEHMQRFVAHRVGDKNLLRLIQRFLKAGVLEDGAFSATDEGTPQGNLVSPVLSNIYLHCGAPGQTWCFQRVKFPPRQEVQPPYRESSLGSEEVTNRAKRRQSDARAVTKVKHVSLVKYLSAGRQHRIGWQAPVGAPRRARWPETAAGSKCTARSEKEASRDLGDPLWSWSVLRTDRVCRTTWLTPEKGRRCSAKSDLLVVLRARESRVHGEAAKQMKPDLRETSPAPTEAGS